MAEHFAFAWSPFQAIGLAGAFCILVRYVCVACDLLPSQSPWYYLTNLFAASLVLISLLHTVNVAAVVVQVIYIGVSLLGVARHLGTARQRRATRRSRDALARLPHLNCERREVFSTRRA